MKKTFKKGVACCLLSLALLFLPALPAASESPFSGGDGTWECTYEIGGTSAMGKGMIGGNFAKTVTLEKIGSLCYVSITQTNAAQLQDMQLIMDDRVAGSYVVSSEGSVRTVCYTLSEENARKDLHLSVYVKAMDTVTNFSIRLNLDSATKLSDAVSEPDRERPAEYIPVFSTAIASEYHVSGGAGKTFVLPEVSAAIGNESCAVIRRILYNGEEIPITNGSVPLDRYGEYTLIVRAECETYKTSLGNPSSAEQTAKLIASAEASGVASFRDPSGTVPPDSSLTVGFAGEGSALYELASAAMETVSRNYQVISLALWSKSGEPVSLTEPIVVDLRLNELSAGEKTEVYRMDENGGIQKLECQASARLIRFETDELGVFIVCEPGVPFRMPRWGYAVIIEAAILAIGGGVLFLIKLRRKKLLQTEAEKTIVPEGHSGQNENGG